ncbi:MAG: enoyl-[acyl-carrier-protein] reductase (NADH) [Hyphomicrobiaceae bacterium]|jgi:enoyl-[acyl-carrier-protein] reductase (NADH)
MNMLKGKRGLLVGIANGHPIAAGCGRVFRNAGAELAVTYYGAKSKPYVEHTSLLHSGSIRDTFEFTAFVSVLNELAHGERLF